jgi:hypothetical protein
MRAIANTSVDVPAAAVDEPGELAKLRAEVTGLRRALESRGPIERAKGVLMYRHGWTAEEAFDHLVNLSQHTNVRLAELVDDVIAEASADRSPEPADEAWALRLLDLVTSPALLLRPLPGHDSPIADFRVEYANPAASGTGSLVGRRLTKIFPPATAADMVTACRTALSGAPVRGRWRAMPLLDRLLLTW